MNATGIVRLRGDDSQPVPVWPAAMADLITTCSRFHILKPNVAARDASAALRREAVARLEDWQAEFDVARAVAAREFAAANRWTLARSLSPWRLVGSRAPGLPAWADDPRVFDHAEPLLQSSHQPAGAVVHIYGPIALDRVPQGLSVDELPASWYWPGQTSAYLLRPWSAQ